MVVDETDKSPQETGSVEMEVVDDGQVEVIASLDETSENEAVSNVITGTSEDNQSGEENNEIEIIDDDSDTEKVAEISKKDSNETQTKNEEAKGDKETEIEQIDLCDDSGDEEPVKINKPLIKVIKLPGIGSTHEAKETSESGKSSEIIIGTEKDSEPVLTDKTETSSLLIEDKGNTTDEQLEVYQVECQIIPSSLQDCLQCAKYLSCPFMLIISERNCYICSEICLQNYRKTEISSKKQMMDGCPSLNTALDPVKKSCKTCSKSECSLHWEAMDFCDDKCLAEYTKQLGTECYHCNAEIPPIALSKYAVRFGNEIMQFCKISCLDDYKSKMKTCRYCQINTSTENCTTQINTLRDFCSKKCKSKFVEVTDMFKNKLSVAECAVCAKLKIVIVEVLMEDKIVQLCSDLCMSAFKFVNKMSISYCMQCKKYFDKSFLKEIVVYNDNQPQRFCSTMCKNVNLICNRSITPCDWCKARKYSFDMINKTKVLPSEDPNIQPTSIHQYFCSLNCLTLHSLNVEPKLTNGPQKRRCAHCSKYDLCLYQLNMSDGSNRNFCSSGCVQEYTRQSSKSGKFIKVSSVTKEDQGPLVGNLKKVVQIPVSKNKKVPNHEVLKNILVKPKEVPQVKNKMTQARSLLLNKGVSCKPNINRRGTQTDPMSNDDDKKIVIPIPVPIYVPCPMAMYSIPVPTILPVPIPVPVPFFIPTTKNNAKEIMDDIKRIQEKFPNDPFEAEILMMAEMVADDKKEDDPNSPETTQAPETFIEDEVMESSSTFGEDMFQMALKMASDLESTQDLDTSLEEGSKKRSNETSDIPSKKRRMEDYEKPDSKMALKFTLGVNAWRHFARNWNKEVDSGKEGKKVKQDLLAMVPEELNASLSLFLKEAKMANGSDYQPDVKYYLTLGIQYYLFESGRVDNIFCDPSFGTFTDILEEEAQRFLTLYPEPKLVISRVEEEHLWESKHFGACSPQSLLTALIYLNTKNFFLTTVEDHMQLSFTQLSKFSQRIVNTPDSQSNSPTSDSKSDCLRFSPCQAALDSNPRRRRVYEQFENKEDPFRCPVKLYNFYLNKCPESAKYRNDVFYLLPEQSGVGESPVWYSNSPLPKESLQKILNRHKMIKDLNQSIQDFV